MVRVVDGVCDMPDICRNKHCLYFDISGEATKRYVHALADMEMLLPDERKRKHVVLEFSCPFLAWKEGQKKKKKKGVGQ